MTRVGTPYYMPPEVIKEQAYNTVCDVWSLGCVIYERRIMPLSAFKRD